MKRTLPFLLVFAFGLLACTPTERSSLPTESKPPVTRPSPTPLPTFTLPAPLPTLTPEAAVPVTRAPLRRPDALQIGLNFIRFYMDDLPTGAPNQRAPYLQPDWIFQDFAELGIHTYRQFVRADLLWDIVEPEDDQWYFAEADTVIPNPDFEPIVTLFAMQYASPTPPWITDPARFEKSLGPEAQEYLEQVVTRYGPYVKYWELGNEMEHWRAADPNADVPDSDAQMPEIAPPDGFSPQEQGAFLAEAAAFIRSLDPDAVIVMPGMGDIEEDTLSTWLLGVIEGGGKDWFDVINYHFYPSWEPFTIRRAQFQALLEQQGLADKPVWLTETGATASESLDARTDYPNSYTSQAADIFRRIVPAYALGDDLVMWHTYIDTTDSPTNRWRLYGVRSDRGEAHPSYAALKLLIEELLPFAQVETVVSDPRALNAYKITTQRGDVRYVVWGTGTYRIPEGITRMTSVIPDAGGGYTWESIKAGETLTLALEPVLLK